MSAVCRIPNSACRVARTVAIAILIAGTLSACNTPAPPTESAQKSTAPVKPWIALRKQGSAAYERGDFAQAAKDLEQALVEAEADVGKTDFRLDRLLDDLGDAQHELGKYAAADITYQRWLALREAHYGAEAKEVGHAWNRIGENWYEDDDVARAKPAFEKAKAIFDRFPVGAEDDAALAMHNLGAIAYSEKDDKRAEALWNQALAIRLRVDGEKASTTATTLYNLAILLDTQRRYDESAALLQRALDAYAGATGPDHPDVAKCLIALVENECRDTRKCTPLATSQLERALAIQRRAYGDTHGELRKTLGLLATLYEKDKDYSAALAPRRMLVALEAAQSGETSRAAKSARADVARNEGKLAPTVDKAGANKATDKNPAPSARKSRP